MTAGLRLVAERAGDGAGQPILDADNGEELVHVQPGVSIVLGDRPAESPGTLYISTRQVVWLSDTDREKGYAVDFLYISLHAVSRDPEAYPSPCMYTQLEILASELTETRDEIKFIMGLGCNHIGEWCLEIETGIEDDESEGSDSENGEVLDLSKITEMRLVPSDPNQLDTLFEVFCECAELNPEPIVEEGGEHNWVFSVDQMVPDEYMEPDWISHNSSPSIGCSNGDHDLARDMLQLQINDERFKDADEMDSED